MYSAFSVKSEILDPAMDALASARRQARDGSRLLDHLEQAAALIPPGDRARVEVASAILMLGLISEANRVQTERLHALVGPADRLVRDVRAGEKRRGNRGSFDYRAFSKHARPHLQALASHTTSEATKATAAKALHKLTDGIPSAHLLSVSVRHELGVTCFTALDAHLRGVPA